MDISVEYFLRQACRFENDSHSVGLSALTLPLLIKPARKPGIRNKFSELTIHEITKEILRKIEKVTLTRHSKKRRLKRSLRNH